MDNRPALTLVPPAAPDALDSRSARRLLPGGPVTFPLVGLGDPRPAPGLEAHLAELGPRPAPPTADDLVGRVAASELTGRGGGHFPVARKWRAVRAATERTGVLPLVVANGSEGEPASAKDAALLCYRPHLVLDGLAQAAATVRATESVLWLHGDAHAAHRAVVHALRSGGPAAWSRRRCGWPPDPAGYLSGESSAVVRALSGGPALPESRRVPTATSGVDGRPTLVQNVETLARVGLLARSGVDAHQPDVVGHGGRRRPADRAGGRGRGAPCRRCCRSVAGRPTTVPQAVLVGGYGGSWVAFDRARDLPVAETSMRRAGLSLGRGRAGPASGSCLRCCGGRPPRCLPGRRGSASVRPVPVRPRRTLDHADRAGSRGGSPQRRPTAAGLGRRGDRAGRVPPPRRRGADGALRR